MIARRGLCLVLAGPSGGGKSSLTRALREAEPTLSVSISLTTRPPRPHEREGIDYFFCDDATFERRRVAGDLLEWARVLGRYLYGTPRAPVEAALSRGEDIVFDIDWQGFRSLRAAMPDDVVGVFLLPPALDALETRLRERGEDSENEIARRMARARDEISHCAEFDHVLVNEDFARTVEETRAILHGARTAASRLIGLSDFCARLSG